MTNILEEVELAFSSSQNAALEQSFREFYKLEAGPRIARRLILEKPEYNRFLKSRMRSRTQYEPARDIDMSFDSFKTPFVWIASITEFTLPSGKVVRLHEKLHEPGGLTESVSAKFGESEIVFMSYFQAEGYALAKFLEEKL